MDFTLTMSIHFSLPLPLSLCPENHYFLPSYCTPDFSPCSHTGFPVVFFHTEANVILLKCKIGLITPVIRTLQWLLISLRIELDFFNIPNQGLTWSRPLFSHYSPCLLFHAGLLGVPQILQARSCLRFLAFIHSFGTLFPKYLQRLCHFLTFSDILA